MKMILLPMMFVAAITLVPLQTNQPIIVRDNLLLGYVGDCCGQDQSIAVDPTNPNRIVAAAGSYYWYSGDGGLTWNSGNLFHFGVGGGDPVLAFDSSGNVYWSSVLGSGDSTSMGVFRSTNGGASWMLTWLTSWTDTTKWLNDKEWLAVDQSQSQFRGRIYVVWDVFVNGRWNEAHNNIVGSSFGGVFLSYSDDHGTTFSSPVKLSREMYDLQVAIGRTGEVYVVGTGLGKILLIKSTDGGKTFGPSTIVAPHWNEMPNPLPNTKVRTNTMPFLSLAVDKRNGNMFVAWTQFDGVDSNILLSRSLDGGTSWSSPIRLNDDPVANSKHQLMPSIAVSPNGVVHAAFVDRRNDPGNTAYDVYYTSSNDVGKTFSRNVRVSANSSNPNTLHDPTFIGDYLGISSEINGTAHIAWGGTGPNSQYASSRHPNGLAIFEATIIYAQNTNTQSATTTTKITSPTETSSTSIIASSTLMMPQPPISQNGSNVTYAIAVAFGVLVVAGSAIIVIKRKAKAA